MKKIYKDKSERLLLNRIANAMFCYIRNNTGITPSILPNYQAWVIMQMIKRGISRKQAEKEAKKIYW